MKILQINKRFDGIRPTPKPDENPDGSYTVRLTITQWQQFQDNIKKPADLLPLEDPSKKPGKPQETPEEKKPEEKKPEEKKPEEKKPEEGKPGDEITITQEPSML